MEQKYRIGSYSDGLHTVIFLVLVLQSLCAAQQVSCDFGLHLVPSTISSSIGLVLQFEKDLK